MTMTADGLAKLLEECGELQKELGELVQIAGKTLAYFYVDQHPDGNGSLATRIENEMGDVLAASRFVAKKRGLSWDRITARMWSKLELFEKWDSQKGNNSEAVDRERARVAGGEGNGCSP